MLSNEEFSQYVKSKPYVIKKMTEILNNSSFKNLRDSLSKKRKKNAIVVLSFGIGVGILIGVLVGIFAESALFGAIAGAVIFLISLGGVYAVYKNAKKNYSSQIAPEVIEALYGPKANYNPKGFYNKEYLVGLDCFPVKSLNQDTLIEGHYFGVPFTVGNVESYHYETRGSGKDAHQEKVTDFYGSVYSFKMNKPSNSKIKITEGSNLFKGKTIEFESSAFNKKFNAYCDDRENAFYIVTPQLQLAMLDIEKALPGGLVFLFRGNELVIVASSNRITFDGIDLKKDDNYNINAILDSILAPAFVIEKMNLDHKFFLNEDDVAKSEQKSETDKNEEDVNSIKKVLKDETGITKEDLDKVKETIDSNK